MLIAILSFLAVSPASAFGRDVSCQRQHTQGDGLHRSITRQLPRNSNSATIGRSSNLFSTSSEPGAVSASRSAPRLNPTLIEAACTLLPWEMGNDGSNDEAMVEEIGTGQQWYETRQLLTKLWVLPRDMSNGSFQAYAKAANDGEDKMLSSVPQLLRLAPDDIATSAKTVLRVLKLPPAMLRREPLLLTVQPDRLIRGFDCLLLAEAGDKKLESTDEKICEAVREACKDTPGLLLEAATKE